MNSLAQNGEISQLCEKASMLWQGVLIIGADGVCADGVLVASPSLVDSVILWRVLIVVRMGRGCKDGEGF